MKTQFGAESSLYATCAFELADGQVREVADMETLRVREPLVDAGGAASAHTQDTSAPAPLRLMMPGLDTTANPRGCCKIST